ncbi:MAG: HAD family phosphatase [Cyclobacteriaceae bacterium]|nr:HAD family phosphatase [Cyclobacteriaceae bacterium HetDA_MAG_MS6]
MSAIRNIIFDLGNVIIDLDEDRMLHSFAKLSDYPVPILLSSYENNDIFTRFERGDIATDEFRDGVRDLLGNKAATDDEIDHAWNGILAGINPLLFTDGIDKIREDYQLIVLSNTNEIHAAAFAAIAMRDVGTDVFQDYFHHVYLSHLMGCRKPDPEAWETILNDHKLKAGETVFLDDKEENLASAKKLGIQTVHIPKPTATVAWINTMK